MAFRCYQIYSEGIYATKTIRRGLSDSWRGEESDSEGTSPDVGTDPLPGVRSVRLLGLAPNTSNLTSMRSSSLHRPVDVPVVLDYQDLHRFRLVVNVVERPDVTNPGPLPR